MIRILAVVAAFAVAAMAPANAAKPSFAYDTNWRQPPLATWPAPDPAPGVKETGLQFFVPEANGTPRSIKGVLIEGAGPGPHPAVLFVHWLGQPATTNHTEFESDAVELAKLGVTSLLIDAPWSERGWFDPLGANPDADLRMSADTVVDLRVSLDLLTGHNVDPRRVAFVGHDFGAMAGMLMASVDRRPSWYVLMAPNSSYGEWYLWQKDKPDRAAYIARLAVLDPPRYLKAAKARGVLLQFSRKDIYIPADHAQAIIAAAPRPRDVRWYDVDHSLETPAAHADRLAWLKARLLSSP